MNKNTVRVMFTGDFAEANARYLFGTIERSGFYGAFELDPRHEDAVLIELKPTDFLTQAQYLFMTLADLHSWHFVGPTCPEANNLHHAKSRRFMHVTNMHDSGDEFTCFGCRKKMPLGYAPLFLDQKEIKLLMMLEMLKGIRPMPHPKDLAPTDKALKVPPVTLSGRQSYVAYDTETKKLPSKKERNSLTQELLGVDFGTLEHATLYHSLGMRHNIDVKKLSDFEDGFGGGDWLDNGSGAVLLIEPNDQTGRARNVISTWMRKNQTSDRLCLALVEIDKQNINGDIFNKEGVQNAAKEFAKIRFNRAAAKQTDYSISPEKLREVAKISEEGAKNLVEIWLKQWPSIRHYLNNGLVAENTQLKEDLDNAEEAKRVLHEDLNKSKTTPQNHPGVLLAADDMLRFLAGINMQDHSIQEQRDFNSKFSVLKSALLDARKSSC